MLYEVITVRPSALPRAETLIELLAQRHPERIAGELVIPARAARHAEFPAGLVDVAASYGVLAQGPPNEAPVAAFTYRTRKGVTTFDAHLQVKVPAGAMHSFKSGHNGINWKIVVKGDVAQWPDYQRCFPVIVHPNTNGIGGR